MTDNKFTQKPAAKAAAGNKSNNKKVLIIVSVVVGALIVLGILASLVMAHLIPKAAETAFETATNSEIDYDGDGGSFTVEGKNGETYSVNAGSGELPEGLPDFVPIYSGATVAASSTSDMSEAPGKTYSVTLTTSDDGKKVMDYYKQQLSAANGYEVKSTRTTSGGFSWVQAAHKASNSSIHATVMTDKEAGETTIQLTTRPIEKS